MTERERLEEYERRGIADVPLERIEFWEKELYLYREYRELIGNLKSQRVVLKASYKLKIFPYSMFERDKEILLPDEIVCSILDVLDEKIEHLEKLLGLEN